MNIMNDKHLSINQIAQLLDGNVSEAQRKALHQHLSKCQRCFRLFRDSAIHRGIWTEDPAIYHASAELIQAGMKVASPDQPGPDTGKTVKTPPGIFTRMKLPWVAAAMAAVLIIFAWMTLDLSNGPDRHLSDEVLKPVREAVGEASRRSLIVIPGGEYAVGGQDIVYRSGFVQVSDSLSDSFSHLLELYNSKRSPEIASWLAAGYIATWQIEAAGDIIADAREHGMRDELFPNLEPLLAYIHEDYQRAEELFRSRLESHPEDPVAAINFAVMLKSKGRYEEASSLLKRIIRDHPGEPVAVRAQKLMESIPTR